jgi:hypothetical protein
MKTITALNIIAKDFLKFIGTLFAGTFGLIWVVGSGYYLVAMLGSWAISGKLIMVTEMDRLGARAILYEQYFMGLAVIFWVAVTIYYIVAKVKKLKTQKD